MFVYNIHFNKTKIVKIIFTIIALILVFFFLYAAYRIFNQIISVNDKMPNPDIINIETSNYTNILKAVHDDLNTYIGKKICFSGYIYRVSDFNENQFVLARDMIISSNLQTLVVGFLCNSNKTKNFEDGSWVSITGEITKGNYYEEIPVIEIIEIKKIEKPKNCYVYPPDDAYVPTVNLF